MLEKAGRDDLVKQNEFEVEVLMNYLPEQLSDEEVEEIINNVFNEINPTGMREMGKVMQAVTPKVKGKTDMKKVSEIIKNKLS